MIEVVQLNPKRQGSASRERYEGYKHATTIAEYIDSSNDFAHFFHDYTKGYVEIPMHAVMSVLSDIFVLPLTISLSPSCKVFGIHRPSPELAPLTPAPRGQSARTMFRKYTPR